MEGGAMECFLGRSDPRHPAPRKSACTLDVLPYFLPALDHPKRTSLWEDNLFLFRFRYETCFNQYVLSVP